tara:strand:+ start:299 stop:517 length:219 start_codon:yes stop_codon:yes gene_type:complete
LALKYLLILSKKTIQRPLFKKTLNLEESFARNTSFTLPALGKKAHAYHIYLDDGLGIPFWMTRFKKSLVQNR